MQDGYYTVATGAISPVDFLKDFTMKYENGAEDYVTLTYSVNDYCYAAYTKGESDAMKELALALYNYGLSAHNYKGHEGGTATCSERAVCTICGNEYGELLDHNYTYTAVQATATITERCTAGCGHEASVKLEAPQNAVYNGNEHPATLTYTGGTAFKGATPTITYDTPDGNAPVNRATYVATLQVGPHSVHVTYDIHRATPEVTVPTANDLTYNGSEQALVTAGTASGGTMLYSLTGTDESFTETIPTGRDAGVYTVYYYVQGDDNHLETSLSVIPVEIKKATPEVTAPTGLTATYGQTLAEVVLPAGWTWVDSTLPVGDVGSQEFDAVFTPTDTDNYNTITKALTVTVSKSATTVTTAPAAVQNLEYTGAAQALVTAGAANGGTVQYKLGVNGTYSTTIPTAIDVGEYTVYWKVVGDSNHSDTAEQSISVSISANAVAKDEVTVGNLETSYTYTGEAIKPVITITVGDKKLEEGTDYVISYGANQYVGEGTITITFKGNYSGEVTVTFTISSAKGTNDFVSDWMPVG